VSGVDPQAPEGAADPPRSEDPDLDVEDAISRRPAVIVVLVIVHAATGARAPHGRTSKETASGACHNRLDS
jgi:hypothetical protein